MTRPAKSGRRQSLADAFAADPEAAVLRVLKKHDGALAADQIKAALQAAGVARAEVDRRWPTVQRRLRSNEHVLVEPGHRYRYTRQPRAVSPTEALDLVVRGRPGASRKAELAAIVRKALSEPLADFEVAARLEQAEVDGVLALVELAGEVEELTANEASPEAMVQRVRARLKRYGLEPIERAGEETSFDRRRHQPIGPPIRDGAPVVVVRPGYVWKRPTKDVLIAKAIVEE
ncbi:MAG TPA: hypothetical protein VK028_03875 [Micromonosporaceae bacterium]|nr:hypothetical protein [Micromonosporaceae bacterium]